MKKKKRFYIDGTALAHELGNDPYGTKVFFKIKDLKEEHKACYKECGIAEIEIIFKKWVKKPKVKRYE